MKLHKSHLTVLAVLFTAMLLLTGCGGKTDDPGDKYTGEDDFITIASPEAGEVKISVADLMKLDSVTEDIVRTRDDGSVDQYPIKGVLLETVLAHLNISADNMDTVRFTAGDGYSVEVPSDIVARGKIILAYEIDGEPLYEENRPIRMYIPQEESMYWVKNTVKITINRKETGGGQGGPVSKIFFFETLQTRLDVVDYEAEAGAKAVKTSDLLKDVQASPSVYMLASDGFEKNEEWATFAGNCIVIQGDNAPAFRGPDLPKGMHVKNLVAVSAGDVGFVFVEKGLEFFASAQVGEDSGISLKDLADKLNLKAADAYVLEAEDGYTVEVSAADLEKGIVFIRSKDGILSSAFTDLPKSASVKYLLSISAVE